MENEMTILNKQMQQYFSVMFEDVRHERSSILILSLTDANKLRQNKFTDCEIHIIKKLALKKKMHFERTRSHIIIGITTRKIFSVY